MKVYVQALPCVEAGVAPAANCGMEAAEGVGGAARECPPVGWPGLGTEGKWQKSQSGQGCTQPPLKGVSYFSFQLVLLHY